MNISFKWLEQYLDLSGVDRDELVKLIGSRLVEVESISHIGEKYKAARFVRVVSAVKIPESDHLSLVKIDDNKALDIDRDETGLIQVVCGASNVSDGMITVWLPPESVVPETYNSKNPTTLSVRDIKGNKSYGMLASAKELDLSDNHEGILDIKDPVEVGILVSDYLELDDFVLEIENKSLTHRPDAFGVIGFARDISGILSKQFHSPDWLTIQASNDDNLVEMVRVNIAGPDISKNYSAVVLSNFDTTQTTPIKIQSLLQRVGVRPINPIVDATNYAMLVSAQPLHAFDYDKIVSIAGENPEIIVRQADDGEELELLDGSIVLLSTEDIVISAGGKAIGLAGAMGGKNTAVDENTKSILLESATFNLYKMRSTQMRHGIFTEAITRFTKGQPAELCRPVLDYACSLISEWTGAKVISKITTASQSIEPNNQISVYTNKLNEVLGTSFTKQDIITTLSNIEWSVESIDDNLTVKAPFWRTDIHIVEDVYEEVGRLNGFDNIVPVLPTRSLKPVRQYEFDVFRQKIRKSLARIGASEVLTYSFVHGSILTNASIDISNSYKVINAISPDLQYYRQSLIPSLIQLIHPNIKAGYDRFSLFEINKVHAKSFSFDDTNVPVESNNLGIVVASRNKLDVDAYYQAIRELGYVMNSINSEFSIESIEGEEDLNILTRPFEPKRSGKIKVNGQAVGVIGEFNQNAISKFKLPESSAGIEINLDKLFEFYNKTANYIPISKYPGTFRDVCLRVKSDLPYSVLLEAIEKSLPTNDISIKLTVTNIYQDAFDSPTKNVTFRLNFEPFDKTLTANEANQLLSQIITRVGSMVDVEVI